MSSTRSSTRKSSLLPTLDGLVSGQVVQRLDPLGATVRLSGVSDRAPAHLRITGMDAASTRIVSDRPGPWSAEVRLGVGGPYTVEVTAADGQARAGTRVEDVLVGDLWVLAGQSNMEGVGLLSGAASPHPLVRVLDLGRRWRVAEDPLHSFGDAADEVHSTAVAQQVAGRGAGLGVAFGADYVKRTEVPVGLIAAAHGGTSLEQWSPRRAPLGERSLFGSMQRSIAHAGGRVRGVLWYQGESDTNPADVAQFADRLRGLVEAVRRECGDPSLPFLQVQLGRFVPMDVTDPLPWTRIRECQRGRSRLGVTGVVAAIDLDLDDLIHISAGGLRRLGRRLARMAVGITSPDAVAVEAHPGDATIVLVRVEGVNGRLAPQEHIPGFSICDAAGGCRNVLFSARVDERDPTAIRLRLTRPLEPDDHVGYGVGLDPYCNTADDEDMALLAFGPVPVPWRRS